MRRTAPCAGKRRCASAPGARRRDLRWAWRSSGAGIADKAEAAFREAASLRTGWAEAHNALGATLCRLGRHDEGIDALSVASSLDDDFVLPRFNLGMAFAQCRRYAEAADAFRRAAALSPVSWNRTITSP